MLETLVANKKISPEEAQNYSLFCMTELGRNWLNRLIDDTYMDFPSPLHLTTEVLAYLEGKRAIIREIKMCIGRVDKLLAEENYV